MVNSNSIYDDRLYMPVNPVADTEELAAENDRLILYHSKDGTTLKWVTDRNPVAGWVVGVALPLQMSVTVVGPNVRFAHGRTFEIHKAGCRDLSKYRGAPQWNMNAVKKVSVCDEIYPPSDFQCESGEYLYDIHFAPCCDKELA